MRPHAAHILTAGRIVAAAISYGFLVLLARIMTAHDFGVVAMVLGVAPLVSVAGAAGQHLVVMRDIPRAGSAVAEARIVVKALRRAAGPASAATAVAAITLGLVTGGAGLFLPSALVLVAFSAAEFMAALARARRRFLTALLPRDLVWRPVCLALVFLMFSTPPTAIGLLWLAGLSLAAINLAFVLWLPRAGSAGAVTEQPPREAGTVTSYFSLWVNSVSNIYLAHIDVFLVGLFAGPEAAGGYFIANRLVQGLGLIQTSHNQVVAPDLALAKDDIRLGQVARRAARRMTTPTLVATAALFAMASPILSVFGADHAGDAAILRLLLIASLANAAIGPGDIALNMSGRERAARSVAIVSMVFGTFAVALATLLAGPEGAAGGVLAATLLRKSAYWQLALRLTGQRTDALHRDRPAAQDRHPA